MAGKAKARRSRKKRSTGGGAADESRPFTSVRVRNLTGMRLRVRFQAWTDRAEGASLPPVDLNGGLPIPHGATVEKRFDDPGRAIHQIEWCVAFGGATQGLTYLFMRGHDDGGGDAHPACAQLDVEQSVERGTVALVVASALYGKEGYEGPIPSVGGTDGTYCELD